MDTKVINIILVVFLWFSTWNVLAYFFNYIFALFDVSKTFTKAIIYIVLTILALDILKRINSHSSYIDTLTAFGV